jgi:hypothetical protein
MLVCLKQHKIISKQKGVFLHSQLGSRHFSCRTTQDLLPVIHSGCEVVAIRYSQSKKFVSRWEKNQNCSTSHYSWPTDILVKTWQVILHWYLKFREGCRYWALARTSRDISAIIKLKIGLRITGIPDFVHDS